MNISEMVSRNRRTCGDTTALIERVPSKNLRQELTWREFDDRINRVASGLMDRGIKKGDIVLHWMMNSIDWMAAYFGIIRTGAIVAPLNFRFTERDLAYCADVAEPKAIIFDELFLEKVNAVNHRLLAPDRCIVNGKAPGNMEGFGDLIDRSSPATVNVTIGDEDPCGLYFTSGTTGDPKPILLQHKAMECMAITEVVHELRRSGDVWVTLKPLYHTGDWIHWLASLILGGTSVIQGDKITPEAIFRAMEEERGTVAMMLVPWLQDVLGEIEAGSLRLEDYDLKCWRLVLLGTQHVPPSLILRWKGRFPWMLYEVNYGLTEACGPGCTHLGLGNDHKVGSIGKAGFNWEARVVDGEGAGVPQGAVGELIVKGNGVMKEYYKNPEKTAQTLRDGWIYTGDYVKRDKDGFLWFVDRKKDVIICGGENVYPIEVEETLQAHPFVHDVGVIALPDNRLGDAIVAVITVEAGVRVSPETEKELFTHCEKALPRYKRPTRIIFDTVLRNPTGKIEKIKMRQKYLEQPACNG